MSVVIPAYNCEAFVGEAICSVLEQTYPDLECIVVDDGSTDSTGEAIRQFKDARYVRQENAGVSSARNRGVTEATGELIAFLDADDVWLPEKLANQVDALTASDRGVGLVYCGIFETDEGLRILRERPAPEEHHALRNTLLMEPPVVSLSQTGLMPRAVFEDIGGFDPGLSTSADTDLVVRIGLRHRLLAVHEPLVLYRTHPAQMSLGADAMEHDMKIVLERAFSFPDLPVEIRPLRRRGYANLRLAVGGARLVSGRRSEGMRDLLGAWVTDPVRTTSVLAAGALKRFSRRL